MTGRVPQEERAHVFPPIGAEVTLYICADCGRSEATSPQAGCCPRCGSMSGNMARAVATISRYVAAPEPALTEPEASGEGPMVSGSLSAGSLAAPADDAALRDARDWLQEIEDTDYEYGENAKVIGDAYDALHKLAGASA